MKARETEGRGVSRDCPTHGYVYINGFPVTSASASIANIDINCISAINAKALVASASRGNTLEKYVQHCETILQIECQFHC